VPEIIPNFHPILVHFTIALLSISVLFYLLRLLLPINHRWKEQWLNMANWSLWTGCLFAIATVIAGWFAYNSVAHDAPSHAAMTLHRNWALPTASLFLLIGLSSINLARKKIQPSFKFLSTAVIAVVLLMVTGWLGSEVVYRYGLGVMSLPQVEAGADGHNHSHGSEEVNNTRSHQHDDAPISGHSQLNSHEKTNESLPAMEQSQADDTHSAMQGEETGQEVTSGGHNHVH
jgi:uncharacterized membrane protein